ncbi:MAG: aminopeptidase [Crocinitomicaceae bacterium]|nr:aminopeptidase [Crocinitomicaceae bacterium]|tara:strand:- start:4296 stop:5432 length:1137 start_codon:yes stop_codon:yes gene_type:complete
MKKLIPFILVVAPLMTWAQETSIKQEDEGFAFTGVIDLEATEVKNQNKSGTCWSFGGVSLFESEMIRMGLDPVNISEMFVVRKAYEMKAERYVRMHGKAQFGPGGQFHDIIEVVKKYGMLLEAEYGGQPIAYGKPHHNEMDAMARAMVNVVVKNPNRKLSPHWKTAYSNILDAYLGELPASEEIPLKRAEELGLDWNKYIEITSFSHLPYYEKSVLLIPDNWTYSSYYNIPLNDLLSVVKNALKAGYTVGWDADVSDRGFSFKNGVAIYPNEDWALMSKDRRKVIFDKPGEEKMVSEEERQELYDNYSTTDDHLMHITGISTDQNGKTYFKVKNSWGTGRNEYGGYIYVSEAYFAAKTVAIMLHKDGVEKGIAKKLKF